MAVYRVGKTVFTACVIAVMACHEGWIKKQTRFAVVIIVAVHMAHDSVVICQFT